MATTQSSKQGNNASYVPYSEFDSSSPYQTSVPFPPKNGARSSTPSNASNNRYEQNQNFNGMNEDRNERFREGENYYSNGETSRDGRDRTETDGFYARQNWGDHPQQLPPRRDLYSQQNHSSPSLAFQGNPSNHSPPNHLSYDAPSVPAIDDINIGLERMQFQSVRGNGGSGRASADGAMEIRNRQGNTASVYSSEGSRNDDKSRRVSVESRNLGAENGTRGSGSYLPYDDHYQPGQPSPNPSVAPSHQSDYYGPGQGQGYQYSENQPNTNAYYQEALHPGNQLQHQHSYGSTQSQDPYYNQPPSNSPYPQQQPPFQPQPPHGGWGYDHSVAAAQNPYYAAATGQLGFPDGYNSQNQSNQGPRTLRRVGSSASSLRSVAPSMSTDRGAALDRSGSSNPLNGTARRKPGVGPPITKASVDEYRSRIKVDPDPEAQFNFAKYLIEAAKKISASASGDEKSAKKYRDALLAESLKLIKRLATQGTGLGKPAYADAQFFLANCLGNGSLGLSVDHEKAYNLYVQASKQNHSSATYRTAVCNEVGAGTRRDAARAILFYRKASALGDTAGMYKLGMILLNGLLGQGKNLKEAVGWLKRAAAQADEDNPHALHELGLLYEKPPSNNSILPFDPAQARELFTQAAQFGYPPSQFKLGCCFEYGSLTCPVDPRRSIAWYTRAAERGDAESELALSGWYLTGSEGILKQSDSEAYLWARRAANKGLPKAEYAVGYYSEVGIGVKVDGEEAKRWYLRAAAQGNKRAMQRLTELKQLAAQRGATKKSTTGNRPTRKDAEKECSIM